MTVEFNGKIITKNRYIGSFIMAISIMIFPLIPLGVITILGEVLAHYHIASLVPGIYISAFGEMWIGGMISLVGLFVVFGRKGSGLSINTHETRRGPDE